MKANIAKIVMTSGSEDTKNLCKAIVVHYGYETWDFWFDWYEESAYFVNENNALRARFKPLKKRGRHSCSNNKKRAEELREHITAALDVIDAEAFGGIDEDLPF